MKDKTYSYFLVLPALVIYCSLYLISALGGVFVSFTHWDLFSMKFAGFDNFKEILTNRDLNIGLRNTIIFTVTTSFFKILFGLILAVFLNRKLKTKNFLRSVYFFPSILNVVTVGLIFSALLHPTGPVDSFFRAVHLDFMAQEWFGNTKIVIYTVSLVEIWKWTGVTMVLFLAGLQAISKEYYEAAELDGANGLEKFRYITFPLIMPAFTNNLVLSLIGGLGVFDIVQVTTGGGPGVASSTLGTIIYKSFGMFRFGLASAGTLMLSVVVLIIVMSCYRALRKLEVEA